MVSFIFTILIIWLVIYGYHLLTLDDLMIADSEVVQISNNSNYTHVDICKIPHYWNYIFRYTNNKYITTLYFSESIELKYIIINNNRYLTHFVIKTWGREIDCSNGSLTDTRNLDYEVINCSNNNITHITLLKRTYILDCSNNPIKRLNLIYPLDYLCISANVENLNELIPLCKEIHLID